MEYALTAVNLSKRYGKKQALENLNLQIPQGKIVALLGPNGSGKSTFLKLFAGLIHPSSGKALVLGEEAGTATKSKVAYVPEFNHLYRWQTAGEAVEFASSFFPDLDLEIAGKLLEQMQLEREQKIASLSKGMQARLKLVLALARNAPVLLLDEPLSGIDPQSRRKILGAIVESYKPDEQTIVLSTHQVLESEFAFDQVIFLQEGKVALKGDADELRKEHNCSIEDLFAKIYQ
ncbi:MAG: ABC transporter ATP-binding protein [Firmicutes bacterium]|nr:ABC transporter ATP-binding protein [Bacillota bacterium]HQD39969.1 ABC transporter ATP-binding protein [Bacillota bacterium]